MREKSHKWQASNLQEGDVPDVLKLFQQVFKTEMSREHWDWKYANGGGVGTVVRNEDGEIAAFYGGIERRILDRGTPSKTLQCCDTMVAATQRGTLTKRGPYFLSATTFLDSYIGYNRPYLFGFGFPNKRVMRLGEHLGVQADIGSVIQVEWSSSNSDGLVGELLNENSSAHWEQIDQLWQSMAKGMQHKIVTKRDQSYIRYRYLENPTRIYTLEFVKQHGEIAGLVVSREENNRLLVLDLLGSLENFSTMIAYCRERAAKRGLPGIFGWLTQADIGLYADEDMRVVDIEVRIPTSACTDGPSAEELMDKLMAKKRYTDRKEWLEEKGNLAEI